MINKLVQKVISWRIKFPKLTLISETLDQQPEIFVLHKTDTKSVSTRNKPCHDTHIKQCREIKWKDYVAKKYQCTPPTFYVSIDTFTLSAYQKACNHTVVLEILKARSEISLTCNFTKPCSFTKFRFKSKEIEMGLIDDLVITIDNKVQKETTSKVRLKK